MMQQYIKNETNDVLSPSVAMVDITAIVCDMLEENVLYVTKNGLTDKAKQSRERLLKLLYLTETFNSTATQNLSLKTHNRRLIEELNEVRRQENIAKSI